MPRKALPLPQLLPTKIKFDGPTPDFHAMIHLPIHQWLDYARHGHWLWIGATSNSRGAKTHHTKYVLNPYGARYEYKRAYIRPNYPVVYDPGAKKTVPALPLIYRMFQHLFKNRYDEDGRAIEFEDRPPLSLGYTVQSDCDADLCVNPRHTRMRSSEGQLKHLLRKMEAEHEARELSGAEITPVIYNPQNEDVIGELVDLLRGYNIQTYEAARAKLHVDDWRDSEIQLAIQRLKSM